MAEITFVAYQKASEATMNRDLPWKEEIANACMGLAGEVGEILEPIKKWLWHGKPLQLDETRDELGDLLFYVAWLCSALDIDMGAAASHNVEKLAQRYPEGFQAQGAAKSENVQQELQKWPREANEAIGKLQIKIRQLHLLNTNVSQELEAARGDLMAAELLLVEQAQESSNWERAFQEEQKAHAATLANIHESRKSRGADMNGLITQVDQLSQKAAHSEKLLREADALMAEQLARIEKLERANASLADKLTEAWADLKEKGS